MPLSDLRAIIGLGESIKFAECTRCHTAMSPGGSECLNCKAPFPENCVIRKITARHVPEENVEAFVSCPGCGRLLRPGVETCTECAAAVTPEYAARSMDDNVTVAQAYNVAARIESFNPGAFIFLALSAGVVVLGAFGSGIPTLTRTPLFFFGEMAFSVWSLVTILRWFRRFGSYESDNAELATARRKVKAALQLWLFVIAVLVSTLAAQLLLR